LPTFPLLRLSCLAAVLAASATARAQDVRATPLPQGHPLVGAWRFDVPGTNCHEIYDIRADGTMNVTSGSQAASSVFEISPAPSAKGFYKWMDKIVTDNGKPDCMGSVMELGHMATNFIVVLPSRRQFLMCPQEEMSTCVGPFKKEGSDI